MPKFAATLMSSINHTVTRPRVIYTLHIEGLPQSIPTRDAANILRETVNPILNRASNLHGGPTT